MANCKKCGTAVDHPVKTWKVKQTSVGLYECPACKAKWRGKFIEELTAPSVAKEAIPEPVKVIQAQTGTKNASGLAVQKGLLNGFSVFSR